MLQIMSKDSDKVISSSLHLVQGHAISLAGRLLQGWWHNRSAGVQGKSSYCSQYNSL